MRLEPQPTPASVTPELQPGRHWPRELWHNLRTALPLLALRRVPLTRFVANVEQALLLLALLAALYFVLDWLLVEWPASVNVRALPATLAGDALLFVLVLLYTRLHGQGRLALPIFVGLESLWFWLTLLFIGIQSLLLWFDHTDRAERLANWLPAIYAYTTAIVAAQRWLPGSASRRVLASAGGHVFLFLSAAYLGAHDLWVAEIAEEPALEPAITEEAVWHAQPLTLQREFAALLPQRPNTDDLYAVGFAGEAGENVFMHEVNALRTTLERRFDAHGRVVSLINNDRTARDVPIATVSNLAATLRRIGKLIDREHDLVMVYLTSHGSEQHELSVLYEPLQLEQLDAAKLARMLDQAGIKWRVIILSACYAGGFIDALKNDQTLILTAADATHPSFGCGPDSDMTYFGRAFVEHALQQTRSLTEAFARAQIEIRQREASEGQEDSNPQMFVGTQIAAKLQRLQQRLDALP